MDLCGVGTVKSLASVGSSPARVARSRASNGDPYLSNIPHTAWQDPQLSPFSLLLYFSVMSRDSTAAAEGNIEYKRWLEDDAGSVPRATAATGRTRARVHDFLFVGIFVTRGVSRSVF
jgi:hypothetical protein